MSKKIDFCAAFDAVLGELAEEIAWQYEDSDIIVAAPSVRNIELGVSKLREVGYEPSGAAVDLLTRYRHQQN
jgi:hypothetical protein